jgi:hypothetical protein
MTTGSFCRAAVFAAALCVGALACGAPPLNLPQPPQDLTALAASYQSPTGTVNTANLQQIVSNAQAQVASSNLTWLPTEVANLLTRVWLRFDENGYPTDPSVQHEEHRAFLKAAVDANRTCAGWAVPAGPADPAANGSIVLTATVNNTELQRNIWGTATSCQDRVQATNNVAVNGFLSASVGMLLQGPLPKTDADTQALVAIQGQVGTQGNVADVSLDFVIVGNQVEIKQQVADGYVIVTVGPQSIGVRGANGSFACSLATGTCGSSP